MSDVGKKDRGWLDWPLPVIAVGLVLMFVPGARYFGAVVFWFGVIALLIRRGAFTPRR